MLLGIPPLISPKLLKVLDEMGHGDTLVIADGNFPAASVGRHAHVIRLDGRGGADVLKAVLALVPIDTYDRTPVKLMDAVPGDQVETPIWDDYRELIREHDPRGDAAIGFLERFEFYREAANAYCVIATGETAQYANVILRKGVVSSSV